MDDRFNTLAGWALGAGIVLLGGTLVTGELFKAERPEQMGYPIEGVVEEAGADAEQPIAHYLQTADATRGQAIFAKCAACHTVNQGGANGLGPNLHGVMGAGVAQHAGFSFSEPLRARGGTWDWDTMSQWLRSPRTFAQGTRMTFAGLSDPQDRADVMVYLNQNGGRLQIPPPPAAGAAPGNASAGNASAGNDAAPAANGAVEAEQAAEARANQVATNNKQ